MWVPLIESGEHLYAGADYYIEKYLTQLLNHDPLIDTIILGCTHYPLLQPKIEKFLANTNHQISIVAQGKIVANSLADYLQRHPEIVARISHSSQHISEGCLYLTTESAKKFEESALLFLAEPIHAQHIEL
jgi:glutamate racemase